MPVLNSSVSVSQNITSPKKKKGQNDIKSICKDQLNYFIPLFIFVKTGLYLSNDSKTKLSGHAGSQQHTNRFIKFSCFKLRRGTKQFKISMCELDELYYLPLSTLVKTGSYLTYANKTKSSLHRASEQHTDCLVKFSFSKSRTGRENNIESICALNYFMLLAMLVKTGPYVTNASKTKNSLWGFSEQHTDCFINFSYSKLKRMDKITQNLYVQAS